MEEELKNSIIEALKSLQDSDDIEMAHIHADDVLCTFLTAMGYADVVDEYIKINKWYS